MMIAQSDLSELKQAKRLLEHPGMAVKLTQVLGTPIEKGLGLLPERWRSKIATITEEAIAKAVHAAVYTMKKPAGVRASPSWHKIAAATTGGVGGFFGLPALAVELPISTTIILRSIADIARHEGEDVESVETQLACVEVFALGGKGSSDDLAESGYLAIRSALAQSVSGAAAHIAEHGVTSKGAPAMVRLIVRVAERFSVQVSEKVAAQVVPAIGAAGGAMINSIFIKHFQDMARGHFTVRRLERKYSHDVVAAAYADLDVDSGN